MSLIPESLLVTENTYEDSVIAPYMKNSENEKWVKSLKKHKHWVLENTPVKDIKIDSVSPVGYTLKDPRGFCKFVPIEDDFHQTLHKECLIENGSIKDEFIWSEPGIPVLVKGKVNIDIPEDSPKPKAGDVITLLPFYDKVLSGKSYSRSWSGFQEYLEVTYLDEMYVVLSSWGNREPRYLRGQRCILYDVRNTIPEFNVYTDIGPCFVSKQCEDETFDSEKFFKEVSEKRIYSSNFSYNTSTEGSPAAFTKKRHEIVFKEKAANPFEVQDFLRRSVLKPYSEVTDLFYATDKPDFIKLRWKRNPKDVSEISFYCGISNYVRNSSTEGKLRIRSSQRDTLFVKLHELKDYQFIREWWELME